MSTALSRRHELEGYAFAHGLPPLDQWDLERGALFVWWWLTSPETLGSAPTPETVERAWDKLWIPPKGEPPDPRGPWGEAAVARQNSVAMRHLRSMGS